MSDEEIKTDAETVTETSEPKLNRAERRAQAQGKKGPANKSGFGQGGFTGGNGSNFRGGANAPKSRLPRTGHK